MSHWDGARLYCKLRLTLWALIIGPIFLISQIWGTYCFLGLTLGIKSPHLLGNMKHCLSSEGSSKSSMGYSAEKSIWAIQRLILMPYHILFLQSGERNQCMHARYGNQRFGTQNGT